MEGLTIEEMQARLASLTAEKEALASQNAEAQAKATELAASKAEAEAKVKALSEDKEWAEEQINKLAEEKAEISMERNKLASRVSAIDAEARKAAPVEFETEDGDEYVFTCPTFTWDDGIVYNVKALEAEAEKNQKAAEKFASMCVHLIKIESGIIRKK
jgi:chromosome segregation ATPase